MNSEERQKRRDEQREQTEEWMRKKEQERLSRPLVERLRDCGLFEAEDGMMGLKVGDYRDAHEAADKIEALEQILFHNSHKYDPLCKICGDMITS